MKNKKENLLQGYFFQGLLLVMIFSVLIFVIRNYLFGNIKIELEESYIEKTVFENEKSSFYVDDKDEKQYKKILEENEKKISLAKKIYFSYVPNSFKNEVLDYTWILKTL